MLLTWGAVCISWIWSLWEAHLFCPYLKALAQGRVGSWYNDTFVWSEWDEWPEVGGSEGGQEILLPYLVPGSPSAAGAEQQTLVSRVPGIRVASLQAWRGGWSVGLLFFSVL